MAAKAKLTPMQQLLKIHLAELGVETVAEYPFAESIGRKWRFDLADLENHVGFECDGQHGGKHGVGYGRDNEKRNVAQMMGWRVFVFTNREIERGKARAWLKEHLK